ncbi:LOW QUALITY PROTEIN: nitric oxide synthase, brain [Daphnia magna]|uniref:LOW QUALITY PROTEIN: nitric oxide synthase, brain n=1 Tax=Daphnia magna TaxID=35525 RepID=UPI001E1BD283|nr:LOW QUALITY PROTEIN: nitric oxide synthase, brain [Daphnia magna]
MKQANLCPCTTGENMTNRLTRQHQRVGKNIGTQVISGLPTFCPEMWLEDRHGVELRNHTTGKVFVDKLFLKNICEGPCSEQEVCASSRMVSRQVPDNYKRPKEKVLQQAKEFLDGFFRNSKKFGSEEHISRLLEVHKDIEDTSRYHLTYDELVYGCGMAWRNAPRCVARVQWSTLKVFDARHVQTAQEMFHSIIEHINYATNQGRLRSVITVFPPRTDGQSDFRVWNSQLISYAGYRNPDGTIKGDPSNVQFTELCLSLGWQIEQTTRFDILPLVLQAKGLPPEIFVIPDDVVLQIPLAHPSGREGVFCDPQRYDISETVASKMELDTSSHTTLWKDTVLLEVNKAVLYSYQMGVNANMSSSISPLFDCRKWIQHFPKPSFEYQTAAWSNTPKKLAVKQIAKRTPKFRAVMIAVRLCSYLYHSRWLKRPKVVLLFASQSGKAENFATKAFVKFKSLFQAKLYCMADYDINQLQDQHATIAIVSTFGDGEAPSNGDEFKKSLVKIKEENSKIRFVNKSSCFAVLGLGSTAYPNFCAFGKFVDNIFQELGGTRLLALNCADELNNQEKAFQTWLLDVTNELCKQYLIRVDNSNFVNKGSSFDQLNTVSARFSVIEGGKEDVLQVLSDVHHKEVSLARVSGKSIIGDSGSSEGHATIFLQLNTFNSENLKYKPGDHLAVFPRNNQDIIQRFTLRLKNCPATRSLIQLQVQNPNQKWQNWKKIAPCTFETLLSRFVDLTGSPSQDTLRLLASSVIDQTEKAQLNILAEDSASYKQWVSLGYANIVDVLEDFSSVRVDAAALISILPVLQPRFYSISSSAAIVPTEIHLTASVVRCLTLDGEGRVFKGLCTSYLEEIRRGDFVACYFKSNPSFHLPLYPSKPMIWIAAGSGIAPFRGFWQQRCFEKGVPFHSTFTTKVWGKFWKPNIQHQASNRYGSIYLYYGCKEKALQPFSSEMDAMIHHKIISRTFFAFSREKGKSKCYVQDLLWKDGPRVSAQILNEGAYVYVCGRLAMAAQVEKTIIKIICQYGNINQDEAEMVFKNLKAEGRYKTDVFGAS